MIKSSLIITISFVCCFQLTAQKTQNSDEKITELEDIIPAERLEKARKWFHKTDINGDGIISLDEFPENIMHFWPLANTNNDNYLTWQEELEYQRLEHEQSVLEEMSKVSRLCEIQHHQDNDTWPKENTIQDVSGEWFCFATMSEHGNPGNGIMYINLTQNGTKLEGDLQQLKTPRDTVITYRIDHEGNVIGYYAAKISGELIIGEGEKPRYNMILLRRENIEDNFRAIFTGSVSADGNSIIAQLMNNSANYGTMLMIRKELLMK